jgi:hypothetical protein
VDARLNAGHDECGCLALFGDHCHGMRRYFKPKTPHPFDHADALGMIFSENRCAPRIKCGAGFFRIMP